MRREDLLCRFGQELEAFARAEAEKRRRKSITLAEGTLTLKTVLGKFIVTDEETAFANARTTHPNLIVTTVKLDTAAYAKAAQESGEEVPRLPVQTAGESFSVKFGMNAKCGAGISGTPSLLTSVSSEN